MAVAQWDSFSFLWLASALLPHHQWEYQILLICNPAGLTSSATRPRWFPCISIVSQQSDSNNIYLNGLILENTLYGQIRPLNLPWYPSFPRLITLSKTVSKAPNVPRRPDQFLCGVPCISVIILHSKLCNSFVIGLIVSQNTEPKLTAITS